MSDPIIMSICIELDLVSNKKQKKMWIWEGSGEAGTGLGEVWEKQKWTRPNYIKCTCEILRELIKILP